VAINTALNKPGFRVDAAGLLREGFLQCAIEAEHCLAVQDLSWIHRDPFERLLVAQAQARGLTLLTCDRALIAYGAAVRWAGRPGPDG
jgi:PIN domain nuclease of toxin-antitoxin system